MCGQVSETGRTESALPRSPSYLPVLTTPAPQRPRLLSHRAWHWHLTLPVPSVTLETSQRASARAPFGTTLVCQSPLHAGLLVSRFPPSPPLPPQPSHCALRLHPAPPPKNNLPQHPAGGTARPCTHLTLPHHQLQGKVTPALPQTLALSGLSPHGAHHLWPVTSAGIST